MQKIAIQGIEGSFHDIAAHKLAGDQAEIVPCTTFDDLVHSLVTSQSDMAVMAIENTIAGSILNNYRLIDENELFITGETYLRVEQNLMVLPGQNIQEIKEVHSHPVALAQCDAFLKEHQHIKRIETTDTALVAKLIRDHHIHAVGAIASGYAAELYGMEIIAPNIETNKQNYTRFLQLSREPYQESFDKVSVTFTVSHETGSLYKALGVLHANQVNLTKIQSTPVIGEPFMYRFFADFLIESTDIFDRTIIELSRATKSLKVLGKYQKEENGL